MRLFIACLPLVGLVAGCGLLGPADGDADQSDIGVEDVFDDGTAAGGACSRRELGEDEQAVFLTAYRVVDGQLGGVCLGEPDPGLEAIWLDLASIAPVELRRDVDVLSMFDAPDAGSDEVTLAFVFPIDDEATRFQMAFNAEASATDADELLLTMAHEFSHVFTGTPDQLDRTIPPEACTTYDNGEGCYRDGSFVLAWIETFWTDQQLAGVGTDEPVVADGEERCDADPGFLGPYAATTPEEDFAESFSAFVLDVEPATPAQAERIRWFADDPLLAEMRDRAVDAGLGGVPNSFETCG